MSEREARVRRRKRAKPVLDSTVPSPCVMVCQLDSATDLCVGCLRSVDEIREWMIFSRDEKLAVLESIEARKISKRTQSE